MSHRRRRAVVEAVHKIVDMTLHETPTTDKADIDINNFCGRLIGAIFATDIDDSTLVFAHRVNHIKYGDELERP